MKKFKISLLSIFTSFIIVSAVFVGWSFLAPQQVFAKCYKCQWYRFQCAPNVGCNELCTFGITDPNQCRGMRNACNGANSPDHPDVDGIPAPECDNNCTDDCVNHIGVGAPPSAGCTLSHKSPLNPTTDACAACVMPQFKNQVQWVKDQGNGQCTDRDALNHLCNGGVSQESAAGCANLIRGDCAGVCQAYTHNSDGISPLVGANITGPDTGTVNQPLTFGVTGYTSAPGGLLSISLFWVRADQDHNNNTPNPDCAAGGGTPATKDNINRQYCNFGAQGFPFNQSTFTTNVGSSVLQANWTFKTPGIYYINPFIATDTTGYYAFKYNIGPAPRLWCSGNPFCKWWGASTCPAVANGWTKDANQCVECGSISDFSCGNQNVGWKVVTITGGETPPPACVSDGSCSAPTPACGQTTDGTDNCKNVCHKTGDACTPPPTAPPAVKTVQYRTAESLADLASAEWVTYDQEPITLSKDFGSAGQKFVFVEFKDSNGKIGGCGTGLTQPCQASIKILGPDPAITNCSLGFEGNTTVINLTGTNFGTTKGTVKSGDKNLEIRQWKDTSVQVIWPNAPAGQELPMSLINPDGQIGVAQCSSIAQLALGAKVFCRAPSMHDMSDVDLILVGQFAGGSKIRQTVTIDKNGVVQGLNQKLEAGKQYTVSFKAPKSLRRNVEFTAEEGTTNLTDFILPVGDIFPLDGGDGVINTADKSELNREWIIGSAVQNRAGDFNQDGRVNSIDWACMRYDFGQQDDKEPLPGVPAATPSPRASASPSPSPSVSPSPSSSPASSATGIRFLSPAEDPSIPVAATSGHPGDAITVGSLQAIGTTNYHYELVGSPIQSNTGFSWFESTGVAGSKSIAVLVDSTVAPGTYNGTATLKNTDNNEQMTFPVIVQVVP